MDSRTSKALDSILAFHIKLCKTKLRSSPFRQNSSTIVEVDIVYHNVSYYDMLLLEEAIYVNNTFDSLQVNGLEIDSYSGKYIFNVSFVQVPSKFAW